MHGESREGRDPQMAFVCPRTPKRLVGPKIPAPARMSCSCVSRVGEAVISPSSFILRSTSQTTPRINILLYRRQAKMPQSLCLIDCSECSSHRYIPLLVHIITALGHRVEREVPSYPPTMGLLQPGALLSLSVESCTGAH